MSLPPSPSPSADEKLAQQIHAAWKKSYDLETCTGLLAALDFISAAHRSNERHVTAYDELAHRIETLFDAIKHGDDEHQQWLRDAITAHFDGRCVPAPTGQGMKERQIAYLRRYADGQEQLVAWTKGDLARAEAKLMSAERERDSALRACADERERCATLREACEVAKVWMKTMFDEMHAKEGFSLSLTALTQDRAFIQAALDGALPPPALAGKQEMESEAGK